MARSEARIAVTIWEDRDFRALPAGAQWLYMFLVSQPDIALTGLLALRERRWAARAADMKPDMVAGHLRELAAVRFVVVDDETEEVLVRSLLRRDEVYRQPNLLRAAEKQLPLIASSTLRAALATEMRRILDSCDMPAGSKVIAERMLTALTDPSPEPFDEPIAEPFDEPNGDGSLGTGDGYGSTSGGFPRSPNSRDPIPPTAGSAHAPSGEPLLGEIVTIEPSGASTGTELVPLDPLQGDVEAGDTRSILAAWIDHCATRNVRLTKRVKGHYAKRIKGALDEGFGEGTIKRALAQLLDQGDAGRPSLLDNKLIDVQNGPRRRPRTLTPGEESVRRAVETEGAQVIELFHEALRGSA